MAVLLISSCGPSDRPSLYNIGLDPQNSSVDEDKKFFQIELIMDVYDDALTEPTLELKTNLDITKPIILKTAEVSLEIQAFSSFIRKPITHQMYEALSKGKIEILDGVSGNRKILSPTTSAKRLSSEDQVFIEDRQISNCDEPRVTWEVAGLGHSILIEFERIGSDRIYTNQNPVYDIGYWAEGFLNRSFYQAIFTAEELDSGLQLTEVKQKISRSAPKVITSWVSSNRNTRIELLYKETEIMNRYVFYDEVCE